MDATPMRGLFGLMVDASRVYAMCRASPDYFAALTLFRFPKAAVALGAGQLTSPTDPTRQMVVLETNGTVCLPSRMPHGVAWIGQSDGGGPTSAVKYLDDAAQAPWEGQKSDKAFAALVPVAEGLLVAGFELPAAISFYPTSEFAPNPSSTFPSGRSTVASTPGTDGSAMVGGVGLDGHGVFLASPDYLKTFGFYQPAAAAGNSEPTLLVNLDPALGSPRPVAAFGDAVYTVVSGSLSKVSVASGKGTPVATLSPQTSIGSNYREYCSPPSFALDGHFLYWADPGPLRTANQGSVMRLDLNSPGTPATAVLSGHNFVTDVAVDETFIYWIEVLAGKSGDTTTTGAVTAIFRMRK